MQQIVRELAGYSLGQGDEVRRAMGKKKTDVMKKQREVFIHGNGKDIAGCVNNGISEEVAITIWNKMADFAKYAFNKSHAAAYGLVAAKTAYYKLYKPTLFLMANLNAFIEKADKLKGYLNACRKLGVEILPPDVNLSIDKFIESEGKIIFGFEGLVNVNKTAILVAQEREENGLFKSFSDFITRMSAYDTINKKFFIRIIQAGGLDRFEGTRRGKVAFIEESLDSIKRTQKTINKDQVSLLDMMGGFEEEVSSAFEIKPRDLPEYTSDEIFENELEAVGMYVSGHPINAYLKNLELAGAKTVVELEDFDEKVVSCGILIKSVKKLYTKRTGELMYSITGDDETGELNCIVFPKYVSELSYLIKEKQMVIVKGKVSISEDYGTQIVVETMIDIASDDKLYPKKVYVNALTTDQIFELNDMTIDGGIPVFVKYRGELSAFKNGRGIDYNIDNLEKLHRIFGVQNVYCKY